MCPQEVDILGDEASKGAVFASRSLQALRLLPNVTVITTYTEQPPVPAQRSSEVCHYPVVKPRLDVGAAMQAINELLFSNSQGSFNREQKQLHSPGNEDTKQPLQKFKSEASHSDTTEAPT